jgi:hypothetical protein
MALIVCPDCKKEVSDNAPLCPQCGRSMAIIAATPPKKSKWKIILIVFSALVAIGGVMEFFKSPEQKAIENKSKEIAEQTKIQQKENILKEQEAIRARITKGIDKSKTHGNYQLNIESVFRGYKIELVYEKGPIQADMSEIIARAF